MACRRPWGRPLGAPVWAFRALRLPEGQDESVAGYRAGYMLSRRLEFAVKRPVFIGSSSPSGPTTFPDSRLFIPKQPAPYINQQDVGLHGLDQPPSLGKVVGFTDQL
jgi:hypothetical protein